MNKFFSKVLIIVIFGILGFLVTYQIKMSYLFDVDSKDNIAKAEIIKQNQEMETQKKEYEKKLKELMEKINIYENSLADRNHDTKALVSELQNLKLLNGYMDVQGEGILLTIEPKKALFGTGNADAAVDHMELLNIVNELYAIGGEVISINDIRLNATTGIRKTADSIRINSSKIYPKSKIVIKAIGKKKDLESAINFPGTIPENIKNNFDVSWELRDDVVIGKDTSQDMKFKYAKSIEKEK
ncbi:Uncharacterized conserved protein YlxW, UPF0749 family [Hathewaya proteolytica DSM 3090]|uniref:Uncharacterized conserved protein YlxW, UPF0749 family n=1 Tax=Hathewaya proteolytica DSM 3090 TaxID=1121331 RepID=A0A1M6L785_9CLOT|nr:DUF881 domain-containing protein [Hathewaya proteolytica]SHJ67046.1 Uncharacterized conserved protein YlxW, UPF0749 family [Hathewaya proteolytica DSM 3090]